MDNTGTPGLVVHGPALADVLLDQPGDAGLAVRFEFVCGRRLRGRSDEVRIDTVRVGVDSASDPALVVSVDPNRPRPGWAGSVDVQLGWRRAGAALARYAANALDTGAHVGIKSLVIDPELIAVQGGEGSVQAVVLGYLLAGHRQDSAARHPAPAAPPLLVAQAASGGLDGAITTEIENARTHARITAVARDLAGAPGDRMGPERLGQEYAALLGACGMQVQILDQEHLGTAGFGGLLAVGGGSAQTPRLLVARRPGTGTRVLLVGKGVTFDTGGVSIKPADSMHLMRTDMAGSAAVVAAAAGFCQGTGSRPDDAALDLTVLVPLAENMISGSAYRPGDVVSQYGGTTTEITNTDAEGRIVLADALAYGIEIADPEIVIDAATLTGVMKIALGMRTGAVFGSDDDLVSRVSAAGAEAGERWWRLPLPADLRTAVDSEVADLRQVPPGPGAVTAALFLERFTDGRPWVHLDIAGPARADAVGDEVAPVATGFAARSLLELLRGLIDRPWAR